MIRVVEYCFDFSLYGVNQVENDGDVVTLITESRFLNMVSSANEMRPAEVFALDQSLQMYWLSAMIR